MTTRTNRGTSAPQEIFIVSSGNQALATGALLSTGGINLASGELGILSADPNGSTLPNNFISAAVTAPAVNAVKLVQGTPNSTQLSQVSRFGINDKAYVESATILANRIVSVNSTKPELGTYSTEHLTGFTAPVANTDYRLDITLRSHQRDMRVGTRKLDQVVSAHNYSTLPAAPTDGILTNLAVKANRQSIWTNGSKEFIVFGIDAAPATVTAGSFVVGQSYTILTVGTTDYTLIGASANTVGVTFVATGVGVGTGTANVGTTISTINAGKVIPFQIDGGTTYNYTADLTFVATLQSAIATTAGLATAGIIQMNLSTAGVADLVDSLLVVGLEEQQSIAYDNFYNRKVRITTSTNLTRSTQTITSGAKETVNRGTVLYEKWKSRHGLGIYDLNWLGHPFHLQVEDYPSYLTALDSTLYTTCVIEFERQERTLTLNENTPHRIVIVLPASVTNPTADAGTPFTIATGDATTRAAVNTVLGAWISSASDIYNNVQYVGEAVAGTIVPA